MFVEKKVHCSMAKFKAGDELFIVESNRTVRKVTVARYSGGIYLSKFEGGGGIQVKEHRLLATKEEAEAGIQEKKEVLRKYRSPYGSEY